MYYHPPSSIPSNELLSPFNFYRKLQVFLCCVKNCLMEKPTKMKARILAFLPKAAATPVTFQLSPPWTPRGKFAASRKGFPCPVIPIIPKEVRGQPKTDSFVAREPNSPEISCIGRVKKRKSKSKPKLVLPRVQETKEISSPRDMKNRPVSIQDHKKSSAGAGTEESSLGQIKQYSSSRGALRDFDWRDHYEENCEKEEEGRQVI
ncbi:hypothetical protein ACOSP7_022586 [Xanthoceras sorbifolium]